MAAHRLQWFSVCFSHSSALAMQIAWQKGRISLANFELRDRYEAARLQMAAQSIFSSMHAVILRTSFSSRQALIQALQVAAHATSISISEFSFRIFMVSVIS
jgi:hypothetical protein